MHIHCVGNGSPSVLFDAGLPYSSLSFELVLRQAVEDGLTDHMTFCSYDRSGYGTPHTLTPHMPTTAES